MQAFTWRHRVSPYVIAHAHQQQPSGRFHARFLGFTRDFGIFCWDFGILGEIDAGYLRSRESRKNAITENIVDLFSSSSSLALLYTDIKHL